MASFPPPSLDELVPENHFVRVVSKTVDELRIEDVFAKNTKGGGASRYNPVMLLKVLIYCYMTGIYSSRMIARQCRENINAMWLAGFQKPDFRTINKFWSEKLKGSIEEIFISTVKLLNKKGYLSLEKYFVLITALTFPSFSLFSIVKFFFYVFIRKFILSQKNRIVFFILF